ncbi:MAG TPA: hypothetical protein VH559_12060 [Gemmatimonadaceae bacterium]|jgi:hypothetical protein
MRRIIISSLVFVATAAAVNAQEFDVVPGARIQVIVSDTARPDIVTQNVSLRGFLVRQSQDSLTMSVGNTGAHIAVPWTSVRGVATSHGSTPRIVSAISGGLAGALVGALVGTPVKLASHDSTLTWGRTLGSFASLGATMGAVEGLIFVRERWQWLRRRDR